MRLAPLYLALALAANPALAFDAAPFAVGPLAKLAASDAPTEAPPMTDREGKEVSLADYKGKVLLVNFWATWCAPCREEMPALDKLQELKGGEDFTVLAVATGRNPAPAIDSFFAEAGVKALPVLLDPKQQTARALGVLGLPVTLLIDREGREVARLIGGADWASPEALALVDALLKP